MPTESICMHFKHVFSALNHFYMKVYQVYFFMRLNRFKIVFVCVRCLEFNKCVTKSLRFAF